MHNVRTATWTSAREFELVAARPTTRFYVHHRNSRFEDTITRTQPQPQTTVRMDPYRGFHRPCPRVGRDRHQYCGPFPSAGNQPTGIAHANRAWRRESGRSATNH